MTLQLKPTSHTGKLWRWNFNLNFTIATVIGLIAVSVIVAHILLPEIRGELSFAISVVAVSAAIYGGFYASKTLRVNVERKKQENAFEILRDLAYRVDTSKIILVIREKFGSEVAPKQQIQIITADTELHKSVLTVLGVFEDASIAVQADAACEKILYTSLGFLVPSFFNGMKPFIKGRRDEDKDNTMWQELEKLSNAWSQKKSLVTGEIFEN